MADPLLLGYQPGALLVRLSRFGDFISALIYDDNDPTTVNAWPAGITIALTFHASVETVITAATWTATIVGDRADWRIPKAQVASQVLDPGNTTARLIYTSATGVVIEWDTGKVRDVK